MEEEKKITAEEKQPQTTQRLKWWASMFTEGELEGSGEGKGLKEAMQAMSIDGKWFFRQIPLILIILGGILLLVTNRYQAQQEIIERAELQKQVEDWKFKALTRSSELTKKTRQSQIEERLKQLGDSTLTPAKEPPFTINPNE